MDKVQRQASNKDHRNFGETCKLNYPMLYLTKRRKKRVTNKLN